jgi:hypothetical protein
MTLVASLQGSNLITPLAEVLSTVILFGVGPSLLILPAWAIFRFATRYG